MVHIDDLETAVPPPPTNLPNGGGNDGSCTSDTDSPSLPTWSSFDTALLARIGRYRDFFASVTKDTTLDEKSAQQLFALYRSRADGLVRAWGERYAVDESGVAAEKSGEEHQLDPVLLVRDAEYRSRHGVSWPARRSETDVEGETPSSSDEATRWQLLDELDGVRGVKLPPVQPLVVESEAVRDFLEISVDNSLNRARMAAMRTEYLLGRVSCSAGCSFLIPFVFVWDDRAFPFRVGHRPARTHSESSMAAAEFTLCLHVLVRGRAYSCCKFYRYGRPQTNP